MYMYKKKKYKNVQWTRKYDSLEGGEKSACF